MTAGVLVVDVQHVFADRDSPWNAPCFAEVHPDRRRLTAGFAGRVVPYYQQFPFALQPPDAPLYALVGAGALGLAGASTGCCVLSTALPAADAGVPVQVVTDACAGATDADHERALAAMARYAPLITLTTTDAVLDGR